MHMKPLQLPPIQQAMEVLQMVTQSELERERKEARDKHLRDETPRLRAAREEGEAVGEARGVLLGRVEVAEQLLKKAPTPGDALRAMSLEQLQELADRLQKLLTDHA